MINLIVDTTHNIFLGVLDENHNWLEHKTINSNKSSSIIHKEIYDLLAKFNKKITDISHFVYCAGPGSYTGMRISDGIAKVVEFSGIKTLSYYQYEVPKIYGELKGMWLANAFKNEVFIYEWDAEKSATCRKKTDEAVNYINEKELPLFTAQRDFLEFKSKLSQEMVIKDPQMLMSYLIEHSVRRDLYYYRSIDEEFTRKQGE